jgi:uncharacterized protein (TIGR02391 family)
MENGHMIKVLLSQLNGLSKTCTPIKTTDYIEKVVVDDYNRIIKQVGEISGESVDHLLVPHSEIHSMAYTGELKAKALIVKSKLNQAIEYVHTKFGLAANLSQLGNAIKSITDSELRQRCLDLLSAEGNFDRVIREATTILEDRIRELSDPASRHTGVSLVDKVLNPNKGILKIDGEANEQEGFYQIFRGVMLSFRDETHHRIVDDFSREDALKVMSLIDVLLQILAKTKKRT